MPAEPTGSQAFAARAATLAVIIPALNEEGSIEPVIRTLLAQGVGWVLVADNGSTDGTARVATQAGARVVAAPRRGYGAACLAGIAALPDMATAVLFCDADGADDLTQLPALCTPVLSDEIDLMIGSRTLGHGEAGALSWPQRTGNLVATTLMRLLYRVRVTDLGPFRCIGRQALLALGMRDQAFGWTAEMQVKAFRMRMRVREIPVDAKCRTAGTSKISGTLRGVVLAGWAILTTILRYQFTALPVRGEPLSHPTQPRS